MDKDTAALFEKLVQGFRILADGIEGLLEDDPADRGPPKKLEKKRPSATRGGKPRGPLKNLPKRVKPKGPAEDEETDDHEEEPEYDIPGNDKGDDDDEEELSIDDMSRPKLIKMVKAKKLDIETKGRKLGELRADVKEALGGKKKKPKSKRKPGKKATLKVLKNTIAELVENHYDDLEESIDALGCEGNCPDCPAPEEDEVRDQVVACLKSVGEVLDLEYEAPVMAVLEAA